MSCDFIVSSSYLVIFPYHYTKWY